MMMVFKQEKKLFEKILKLGNFLIVDLLDLKLDR
jgi:hypothetical protein